MKIFFLTLLTGTFCGMIDILPMLKMKLDLYSIASAFVFYLIVPFVVYRFSLPGMTWWLKGGVVTLILALPIILIVAKDGIKSAVPILLMSVLLGTLIGIAGKFVIKVL